MKREIENNLQKWKISNDRKPLIIQGARQIGKTYIIKEFGKDNYENVIYINFENNNDVCEMFDESIDISHIIKKLELYYNEKILANKTLLIFDEIQSNNRALTSLKYFCEETPNIHIIAAGSLLGVAINSQNYSFPVGKVQIFNMYPLSFKEFLMAINRKSLIKEIEEHFISNKRMDNTLHNLCLELYRTYLTVGGMPAVINKYLETSKLIEIKEIQDDIIMSYKNDMSKYASLSESNKILGAYNSIPVQLAKENSKFQYKIIQKGGTSSIFGESLLWLNNSGLINQVYKTTPNIPLEVYKDLSSFKIYLTDVALLVNLGKYPLYHMNLKEEINMISMGPLTENYVANELRINGYERYYWQAEGRAEVDFLISKETDIIPIEVKSNSNVKSRSLNEYIKLFNPKYSIRISSKNFGFENNIKSVPLYAVFCI